MTWGMLDLFSGIGGFSLAAQSVWGSELEILAFVEIDKWCQSLLRHRFPGVPIIGDVRDVTKEKIVAYSKHRYESSWGIRNRGISKKAEDRQAVKPGPRSEGGRGKDVTQEALAHAEGKRSGSIKEEGDNGELQYSISSCKGGQLGIDLLTGGFPCQPFSTAGRRRGAKDDRFLWPEMLRVIQELRPRWICGENVNGITSMVQPVSEVEVEGEAPVPQGEELEYSNILAGIVSDLERIDYSVQVFSYGAVSCGAPHRRMRVWIVGHDNGDVAHSTGNGFSERTIIRGKIPKKARRAKFNSRDQASGTGAGEDVAHGPPELLNRCRQTWGGRDKPTDRDWRQSFTHFRRVVARLPSRLDLDPWRDGEWEGVSRVATGVKDRVNRLKGLGNAIVPQCVMPIFEAIKAWEEREE